MLHDIMFYVRCKLWIFRIALMTKTHLTLQTARETRWTLVAASCQLMAQCKYNSFYMYTGLAIMCWGTCNDIIWSAPNMSHRGTIGKCYQTKNHRKMEYLVQTARAHCCPQQSDTSMFIQWECWSSSLWTLCRYLTSYRFTYTGINNKWINPPSYTPPQIFN